MPKESQKSKAPTYHGLRVVPDSLDFRDRMYNPSVNEAPPPEFDMFAHLGKNAPRVRNQHGTRACTGFALAAVIDTLLAKAPGRRRPRNGVSAMMLYSMAQKYDEFNGDGLSQGDVGSSVRGAMKGWRWHGATDVALWPESTAPGVIPPANDDPRLDWWAEAVQRPLGAYYRIDYRSVTDMHVAIRESGALVASARAHEGWIKPPRPKASLPVIAVAPGREDWGHAFAIVGYNADGFIILNSYGKAWGSGGRAILRYEDWTQNAMDCWVAQLGVVTTQHEDIATSQTLRVRKKANAGAGGKLKAGSLEVVVSPDPKLAEHEVAPFVIDMSNNGELSSTGRFRTSEDDIRDLLTRHLGYFKQAWHIGADERVKVGIYAHGGLVGEGDAAAAARAWVPAMYEQKIFPIFLMWETDVFSTFKNRLSDLGAEFIGADGRAGGLGDQFQNWWNTRIEQTVARPAAALWKEIKQNGSAISTNPNRKGGGQLLYDIGKKVKALTPADASVHLIGHSAGSVVHAHIVDELVKAAWKVRSIHFMAPAITMEEFLALVAPQIRDGSVKEYHQYHLTAEAEEKDPTCRPILGYSKSLLYLVSNACEGRRETPILGMEKFVADPRYKADLAVLATFHRSPGSQSQSTTHGGFDDDPTTRNTILRAIAGTKG